MKRFNNNIEYIMKDLKSPLMILGNKNPIEIAFTDNIKELKIITLNELIGKLIF